MSIDFFTPHDPRWLALLERAPHQFYHLPGYAELWASHDQGQAEAVLVSNGSSFFFLPYTLLRQHGSDPQDNSSYYDLRSPYGYPGPLIYAQSPGFLTQALKIWSEAMRDRRVISGFVRLDPLAHCHTKELAETGHLCFRGSTVSIDLTIDEACLWQQIRLSARANIRQARAAGLSVRTHVGEPPWDHFCRIYYETMDRVSADSVYYFPRTHFEFLARLLGDRLWIGSVESSEGEVLAVGLFIEYGGLVHLHLQATTRVGLPLSAAKLLIFRMTLLAKRRGNRVFHLGGGRGASADSLFQFKSGFSKRQHPFFTWHIAFLPQEYHRLVNLCRQSAAPEVEGFFPAYRSRACS